MKSPSRSRRSIDPSSSPQLPGPGYLFEDSKYPKSLLVKNSKPKPNSSPAYVQCLLDSSFQNDFDISIAQNRKVLTPDYPIPQPKKTQSQKSNKKNSNFKETSTNKEASPNKAKFETKASPTRVNMIKYPPNLYRKSSLRPQTSHANKGKSFTPPRKRSGKSDEQFELERDEAFRHFVRTEYEVQISSLENANEALKKENQELKQQLLVPQEPQECISTQTDENVSKNIMMYSFDVDTKLSDAETKIRTLQVEKEWLNSRIYVMQKEIMSRQDAKSALDNINEKQKLIDTISQAKQAINNLEDENASLKKDLHEAKERIYYLTYKAGILFDGSSNALH